MDTSEMVNEFIHDTTWQGLPPHVQRQAKRCLVDAFGATLSGTLTRVSKIAANFATENCPGDEATILCNNQRSTAAGAALANAVGANGFDSDDVGKYTKGHPGAQIVPTALALGEKLGSTGEEMLAAVVIGYEVAHRAGRCWHDHHTVYQACGSWGSVTNAAVAAHLMDLNVKEIGHALGIADYHAPNLPMMRDIDHPAMVKHGIGWGAFTGISAAELARLGFTGVPSVLEMPQYRDWVADIGEHFIMAEPGGVLFKEYTCCGWAHAALDATRRLIHQYDITADCITRITVTGFHEMVRLGSTRPTTTEQAQFSLGWPLAMLILDGEVGPRQMQEGRLNDERAIDLLSKIDLVESREYTDLAHQMNEGDPDGKYLCDVSITVNDGATYCSDAESGGIDFGQGWDDTRVKDKFYWLAGHVVPEERVERLLNLLTAFDELSDVSPLVEIVNQDA
jgi:2-methylcitrate dehydratase PrpD